MIPELAPEEEELRREARRFAAEAFGSKAESWEGREEFRSIQRLAFARSLRSST